MTDNTRELEGFGSLTVEREVPAALPPMVGVRITDKTGDRLEICLSGWGPGLFFETRRGGVWVDHFEQAQAIVNFIRQQFPTVI